MNEKQIDAVHTLYIYIMRVRTPRYFYITLHTKVAKDDQQSHKRELWKLRYTLYLARLHIVNSEDLGKKQHKYGTHQITRPICGESQMEVIGMEDQKR